MSDLKLRFEQAVAHSRTLNQRPDNATLLKIYALFKQATDGDNDADKPSFTDLVARAKWDAWKKLEGTGADEAMHLYIDLIDELHAA